MFDYKRIDFGKIANKAMKPIAPKCGPSDPEENKQTPHPNTGVVVRGGSIPLLDLPPAEVDKESKENVDVKKLK